MRELNNDERALEDIMYRTSQLPESRGACVWGVIAGREVCCSPVRHKDGSFKTWKFVVGGQLMRRVDVLALVRDTK
jgi:hypothetical protein